MKKIVFLVVVLAVASASVFALPVGKSGTLQNPVQTIITEAYSFKVDKPDMKTDVQDGLTVRSVL